MSFIPKQDWFNLTGSGGCSALKLSDSSFSGSMQLATASDEWGDIANKEAYGLNYTVSNSYKLCASMGSGDTIDITLGGAGIVQTFENGSINGHSVKTVMTSFSIGTSAGGEPTISASGEMTEDTDEEVFADDNCYPCEYEVKIGALNPKRHAQLIDINQAVPCAITNGYLVGANYDINCSLAKSTVNGVPVAADVTGGVVTCNITINAKLENGEYLAPSVTLTPNSVWKMTTPLSMTDGDASFKTYTAGFTMYLKKKDNPNV